MSQTVTFRILRGEGDGGSEFVDYRTEVSDGMVVLDVVHKIQAEQANDLACRWNCKAGKCGSCSAEINGMPKLMCMTRLDQIPLDQPVTIAPMKAFPRIRDLATDPNKRELFGRLAEHHKVLAAEIERAMTANASPA